MGVTPELIGGGGGVYNVKRSSGKKLDRSRRITDRKPKKENENERNENLVVVGDKCGDGGGGQHDRRTTTPNDSSCGDVTNEAQEKKIPKKETSPKDESGTVPQETVTP